MNTDIDVVIIVVFVQAKIGPNPIYPCAKKLDQKNFGKKQLGPKKAMVQKIFVQNIKFKKNVASKKIWVQKHFGVQKT